MQIVSRKRWIHWRLNLLSVIASDKAGFVPALFIDFNDGLQ